MLSTCVLQHNSTITCEYYLQYFDATKKEGKTKKDKGEQPSLTIKKEPELALSSKLIKVHPHPH